MSDNDWTEDFAHENGCYGCRCLECDQPFVGHKRRVICRVCKPRINLPTPVPTPRTDKATQSIDVGSSGVLEVDDAEKIERALNAEVERLERELAESNAADMRALRIGYAFTPDCQSVEEMATALVERIRRLEAARSTAEPVAWVIPGDDNARHDGALSAMAWQEGEFSCPLYAGAPPTTPTGEPE